MTGSARAAAIVMCAAIACAPVIARPYQQAAQAAFELPAPTGPYPVASTSWRLTDRSRPESFGGPGEFRQVEVLAWYPGAPNGGATAPYLREGLPEVRAFAKLFGAETGFDAVKDVRTHAALDGVPAASPRTFPVLVFSHGYTGIPSSYTALLEDLASHGYAVLSVVHPYEATLATLEGGRVVSVNGPDGKFVQGVQDVLAEWEAEDATMTAVTKATDPAEQLQLMRGYLGGLRKTEVMLHRWVNDTRLVLDQLSSVPKATAAGRLIARLDTGRLGAFGHSMGGVSSAQFCVEDGRCRAGLNLDGIPQYGPMIDTPMPHPFLMVYSERPGRAGASDPIYRRSAHPYYRVDVQGTRHLEFSDMVFWGGPLRPPVLGTMAPRRAVEITRAIVRQYFDQILLGKSSPLLAGQPVFPEVSATRPSLLVP